MSDPVMRITTPPAAGADAVSRLSPPEHATVSETAQVSSVSVESRTWHMARDLNTGCRHPRLPSRHLTSTADQYLSTFGFEPIERREVPASVQASIEFTSACPVTAIVMRKWLSPDAGGELGGMLSS